MKKGEKFTIGLLVSGITDSFTISVCRGVIKAAKKSGIKLVIFPAKYLDRDLLKPNELMYDYQYNTLFSCIKKENVDAILVAAGSIGFCSTTEKICKMLLKYNEIPCVLIASKMDGYISVNYDNSSGIREAMEYLINKLNCTKIGMIGGPDNNTDAFERKQAYLDTLKKNGIAFEERRFVEGRLTKYSYAAFEKFIEQNPDVEAVFCVNDDTAIGFYDALRTHNIQPGKQVMVFGYDNTLIGSRLKPALSSVLADLGKLGEETLKLAVRMLEGEAVESIVLPTKFIRRDSIRSQEEIAQETDNRLLDFSDIDISFDNMFYYYENEDSIDAIEEIRGIFERLIKKITYICEEKETGIEHQKEVMEILDVFLEHRALKNIDMENFVSYIEKVYKVVKSKNIGVSSEELRDIFAHVYRRIILTINEYYGEKTGTQYDNNCAIKLFVRDSMQFQKGNDESYLTLLKHLARFDIKNAYIYLFEKPVQHLYQEEAVLPEKLYMKATLKNGDVQNINPINQETDISDIFENKNINDDNIPKCLFPLYSNEMLYGVILCDMTETLYDNGDFLVNQISSAVKVIELLRTNDMIQKQLENSIESLKENNITLDSLSKIDPLTGIFNRRGFYDAVEDFLIRNKKYGNEMVAAYVDMNNLKIINDKYGHNDGDFAIKKIAELLTEIIGKNGIVGRIGGDEYAFIMLCEDENSIVRRIYNKFAEYNQISDKVYNITVSVGTCKIERNSNMTLEDALAHADERLYEEKKHKPKSVDK